MNYRVVFNVLGKLLVLYPFSFALPIIAAYFYGEALAPFLIPAAISIFAGLFLVAATRNHEKTEVLKHRESFTIVALVWLLMSLIGSLPYVIYGVGFVDAFFESMSGFTTTGATVLVPETLPNSLLLWRSQTQWIGGMGIIVLFLVIFPNIEGGTTLFYAEYPLSLEKVRPRVRDTATTLYKVYLTLTALEIALLYSLGLPLFDAVNHSFTTISTGGFSTHSDSIAYFNDVRVEAVIATFAFLGGTNFALLYMLFRGKVSALRNPEFKAYVSFIALFTLIIALINLKEYGFLDSLRYAAFQVVSVMTTTGFTTADFDKWSDSARLIFLFLMLVGGCSGSTAGGIKVVRIYLLIKYAVNQILRAADPRTVRVVKFGGKAVRKELLDDVAAFFILYVFLFILSSLLISLFGYDIATSLSATAATLGNVGPGLGMAGAEESYALFPLPVKILLAINMWIGRLEIFTVVSLFIPSFWRERW